MKIDYLKTENNFDMFSFKNLNFPWPARWLLNEGTLKFNIPTNKILSTNIKCDLG